MFCTLTVVLNNICDNVKNIATLVLLRIMYYDISMFLDMIPYFLFDVLFEHVMITRVQMDHAHLLSIYTATKSVYGSLATRWPYLQRLWQLLHGMSTVLFTRKGEGRSFLNRLKNHNWTAYFLSIIKPKKTNYYFGLWSLNCAKNHSFASSRWSAHRLVSTSREHCPRESLVFMDWQLVNFTGKQGFARAAILWVALLPIHCRSC